MNDTTVTEQVTYSQEDYLLFAQTRRIRFVQAMENACGGSEGLATLDPERQSNYLAAIRDVEKQTLTLAKMKQDKDLAEQRMKQDEKNDEARNAAIAALILNQAKNINVSRSRNSNPVPDASQLPVKPLIAGETDIGDRIENYQEYRNRTGQRDDLDPLSFYQDESDA